MANEQKPQLRIGIIGAGIGGNHIKGYAQVKEAEVVAICDLNQERAQKTARDNGLNLDNVQIFADHREMLEKGDVDAVSVGVPNTLHRDISVSCMDAGKHVLCEKPLAMNVGEAQDIADAASRNNVKCMVGQVMRFRADSQFVKNRVLEGDLGRVYYARSGMLRKRGIPGYGGWFTTKAMSGGGPLIDIGVHMLDLAWWLCGCPKPLTVSGSTWAEFGPKGKGLGNWMNDQWKGRKPEGTFDVEDLAMGLIRFEGGITINLEVSWALNSRKDANWCQIFGAEGGAEWGENTAIFKDAGDIQTVVAPTLPKSEEWPGEMQHFVNSILNDTTPDPDATQGVTMIKMLSGLYESAALGREIEIK